MTRRNAALALEREVVGLRRVQRLFAAHLRTQGRIRISKGDLDRVQEYALRVKPQENGDLMVTFEEPEPRAG